MVLLSPRSAFKIPRLDCWRRLLTGLLANMDERELWRQRLPRLCPIRFSVPGGWLVVMVRAAKLSPERAMSAQEEYFEMDGPKIQLDEAKLDAFGEINGDWVIVDYGGVR